MIIPFSRQYPHEKQGRMLPQCYVIGEGRSKVKAKYPMGKYNFIQSIAQVFPMKSTTNSRLYTEHPPLIPNLKIFSAHTVEIYTRLVQKKIRPLQRQF